MDKVTDIVRNGRLHGHGQWGHSGIGWVGNSSIM